MVVERVRKRRRRSGSDNFLWVFFMVVGFWVLGFGDGRKGEEGGGGGVGDWVAI